VKSRLDDLIPGLREGLQMMVVGSQALFLVPADLTFGRGPWPEGVAPGTPLIYRIELEDVQAAAP
jgi:FKBP-type peptidyl-prolyl cis-trans isomerase